MHLPANTGTGILAGTAIVLLILPASSATGTEIYRCKDEYGNVEYTETPCPADEAPEHSRPDIEPEVEPDGEDDELPVQVADERTTEEVEACKQALRDSIDAIEAEMLRGFSPEEGEAFKSRLIALTRQMRACG